MTAPAVTTAVERVDTAIRLMRDGRTELGAISDVWTSTITRRDNFTSDLRTILSELDRLSAALGEAREALTDIGIYGCGMLNQPAAMNAPNEQWLERRIAEYERRARTALQQQEARDGRE